VRALIVVPTRELAIQVAEHALQLARFNGLRIATIYGGVGFENQIRDVQRGVDIVVATPGRLLDLVERRVLRLSSVEILVLDEADRMLDVGFLPDLRRIVQLVPAERQTMLFSATFPPEIVRLANEVTRDAEHVSVAKQATPNAISQALFPVPEQAKLQVLTQLLRDEEMRSVLVFARTKHRADRLAEQLRRSNIKAGVIHGNRSQGQRVAALEAFRRGHSRVLVATDIAARGIDVEGVSHVINYDMPMQPEDYIHRIGRTGRAEAAGTAYTLATPVDEDMVRRIQHVLKQPIQRRRAEGMPESVLIAPPAPAPVRRSFGSGRRNSKPMHKRRFARI
jgi:ATP-dependent RNA helicase RhlE